jgi:hypothetical protein
MPAIPLEDTLVRPDVPITILKAFAWLSLVAGGLVTVISLATAISTANSLNQFGLSPSPGIEFPTLALALAPSLYGVLLWAFLLVIALIAENLLDINKTTYWIAEVIALDHGIPVEDDSYDEVPTEQYPPQNRDEPGADGGEIGRIRHVPRAVPGE